MTNYQLWQLENKGDILPEPVILPSGEVIENGMEELERLAEWIDAQAEQQRVEQEYQTY